MRAPTHPLHLAAGFSVWLVWLVVVYGAAHLACRYQPPAPEQGPWSWINLLLLLVTAVTAAALAWQAWRCRRAYPQTESTRRFVLTLAGGLYAFAAAGVLVVGFPAAITPPCV